MSKGLTFGPAAVPATCNHVVPFPLARRRAYLERHARLIASMRPEAGERHLERQLKIQYGNLQRLGFDPHVIEQEIIALDTAIRAELCRAVHSFGERK